MLLLAQISSLHVAHVPHACLRLIIPHHDGHTLGYYFFFFSLIPSTLLQLSQLSSLPPHLPTYILFPFCSIGSFPYLPRIPLRVLSLSLWPPFCPGPPRWTCFSVVHSVSSTSQSPPLLYSGHRSNRSIGL